MRERAFFVLLLPPTAKRAGSQNTMLLKPPTHQDQTHIFCEFSRSAVEAGDFAAFLEHFALERLPHGPALRSYYSAFHFAVAGYDTDPRELYEIPEVRAFYQAFRAAWPFWFFACDLENPCLQAMTFCCLPFLQVRRRSGAASCHVQLQRRELGEFLHDNFRGLNLLFDRAGMMEAENRERSAQIVAYYRRDWSEWVGSKSTPNKSA